MVNIVCRLAICGLVAAGSGCVILQRSNFATWEIDADTNPAPAEAVLEGIPLRSGQIVASEQGSPQSLFLSLLVAESLPWVHTGVVAIEGGVPWLYEAQGEIRPTLKGPPTRNIGGGVRRVPLDSFIERERFIGIFDPPPGVDGAAVARYARERYLQGTRFDAYFDTSDPSKVYCGEFTALALSAGGAPPRRISPFTANRSLGIMLDWLEIRSNAVIPAGMVVEDGRRVALLSAADSRAQIAAYFAMKDELHRRFTPEQKLGNVLSFSPIRMLGIQPEVQAFMDRVNDEAAAWDGLSSAELVARVRKIAAESFGDFEVATSP